MKQWQITDQWDLDSLKLVDADVPEPGPGDVLLKMKAVSLNFRDYLMVHHKYGSISGELPLVPLSDGVGEVVALGDGVEDIPIGSRRVPCFNQGWLQGDLEEPPMKWTMGMLQAYFDGGKVTGAHYVENILGLQQYGFRSHSWHFDSLPRVPDCGVY